jgi:poly(3-hydroxybutyrate) depolymerase
MKHTSTAGAFCLTILLLFHSATPLNAQPVLKSGADQFIFQHSDGKLTRPITVWTYHPKQLAPDARVLFVMHGVQRDGERYRDQWRAYAERYGALLLVPEFSAAHFPGSGGYSSAKPSARTAEDDLSPAAYSAIEGIFDQAIKLAGVPAVDYRLYGHSAGAQFVHRFIMFNPTARMKIAVAANAGWYMMPDFDVRFPYGLKGSGIDSAKLRASLAKKLVVLLAEKDIDPQHPSLNRGAGPMLQGRQRFDRGQNFFHTAQQAAEKLQMNLSWELATVANADHDNAKMAPAAAPLLLK